MKKLARLMFLGSFVAGGALVASVAFESSAEAAACVRGVRGAACAGPRGAVAVRRPPVVRVAPVVRRPVYAPRRRVIVR